MTRRRTTTARAATTVTAATALALGIPLALQATTPHGGSAPAAAAAPLTTFSSCEEVDRWLAASEADADSSVTPYVFAQASARAEVVGTSGRMPTDAVGTGATGTNVQEANVDEPDSVKSRDGLIVTTSAGRLRVLRAPSAGTTAPAIVGTLTLPGRPSQVEDAQLLWVGSRVVVFTTTATSNGIGARYREVKVRTTASIIDIADPAHPSLVRTIRRDGGTVSARATGGRITWVTHSLTRPLQLDCTAISHPEKAAGAGVLRVDTIDPAATTAAPEAAASHDEDGSGVRGSIGLAADGSQVYASADRLYVATTPGGWWFDGPLEVGRSTLADRDVTTVHAFDLRGSGAARYVASGTTRGVLLNQWSMSERDGVLRLATTRTLPVTATPRPTTAQSTSRVIPPSAPRTTTDAAITLLKEDGTALTQVGQLTGLGKGERIYSVRWFDDRAVVVTFRQTDPLYVVDLTSPRTPKVSGELKVTGNSSYLHPIGDHRLLGIGESATARGVMTGTQISTFDLSAPNAPKLLSRLQQTRTWSRLDGDARLFAYLPQVRVAVTPLDGAIGTLPGGLIGSTPTTKKDWGLALQLVKVDDAGRLTSLGGVRLDGEVRVNAVDDDTIAVVRERYGTNGTRTHELTLVHLRGGVTVSKPTKL